MLRIAQEALHNAEKHASANHILVASAVEGPGFRMAVCDDGTGFNHTAPRTGFGLHSLHERARLAGGELMVESTVGSGTQVVFEIMQR